MEIFRKKVAELLEGPTGLSQAEIGNLLEVPPQPEMGDFAFPCFHLAQKFRKSPAAIAADLMCKLNDNTLFERVSSDGPYLNLVIARSLLAVEILTRIHQEKETFGSSDQGKGKTVVIDFSSPNIAKPFSIGHLRSTVIGHSLSRLYSALGYKVVGINHLGDWGTQFGKLITAFKKWGRPEELHDDPIGHFFHLYVRFHTEAEKTPQLEEEGRFWFRELEKGNEEALLLWKEFRDLSLREFKRIYDFLGIEFDEYQGESFYNKRLAATLEEIKSTGITRESQGALVVDLGAEMPPCLLQKTDGATLYATRDISAALYRYEKYKFAYLLYVVGSDQILHFKQFLKVLQLMGRDWSSLCQHVPFGMVRFKEGKMSTRKGRVILLEEVLNKAVELALGTIQEKNPTLENKEKIARQVGVGAVIFGDLSNDRTKDVLFDWGKILDFSGETAPYIQYSHARICSILRQQPLPIEVSIKGELYTEAEEKVLLLTLGRFPAVLVKAVEVNKPSVLARYLLILARDFNHFYHNCPVLKAAEEKRLARLLLIDAVRLVLKKGLYLLGIEAPEEM